jgi:hypothetical protein
MENFALLPHRAEAHTTVLSKPVGQCFYALVLMLFAF